MYRLDRTQFVRCPRSEVFPFFADPANLARITPPELGFRIVGHESPAPATGTADIRVEHADVVTRRNPAAGPIVMQAGLRIHYRVSPLGFPQAWTSVITEWQPPDRFADEQARGPYKRWRHVHQFIERDGGTEIRDTVEYELPFGPLGRLAHLLLVQKKLERIFDYRRHVIEDLFGPSPNRENP